jgi:hypothetical protein
VGRRDLSHDEISQLRAYARKLPDQVVKDRIERLCGEVLELRDREASVRHMNDLEGEW